MSSPFKQRTSNFLACPWTLKDVFIALVYAVALFFVFLFWWTAAYFFLSLFLKKMPAVGESLKIGRLFWALPLFYVALFSALKIKIFRKYNIAEWDYFIRHDQLKEDIAYGFSVFVKFLGTMLLLSILVFLVAAMWDMVFQSGILKKVNIFFLASQVEKRAVEHHIKDTGLIAIVLFFVVAPFFEELFFRGCLYTALRLRFSRFFSNIISSFIFSLLHGYSWLFGYIFFVGLILATMYEKRRSLVAPLTFHMLNNLTVVLLFFL